MQINKICFFESKEHKWYEYNKLDVAYAVGQHYADRGNIR